MFTIGSHVYVVPILVQKTFVRTVYGNINSFELKVEMHQGSAFSTLLFVIVIEVLSRKF